MKNKHLGSAWFTRGQKEISTINHEHAYHMDQSLGYFDWDVNPSNTLGLQIFRLEKNEAQKGWISLKLVHHSSCNYICRLKGVKTELVQVLVNLIRFTIYAVKSNFNLPNLNITLCLDIR